MRKGVKYLQHITVLEGTHNIPMDGSFEHPKHMLKIMGKKIFTILR